MLTYEILVGPLAYFNLNDLDEAGTLFYSFSSNCCTVETVKPGNITFKLSYEAVPFSKS